MGDKNDTERIHSLEGEVAEIRTEVALVKQSTANTERTVTRLEDKFDRFIEQLSEHFVPRAEHGETQKNVDARLARLEEEVAELRSKQSRLPAWGQAVFTVLVGVISAVAGGHFLH